MTRRTSRFVVAGLLVALLLAGAVSGWASRSPDGLEQVAAAHDMQAEEPGHEAPFGDYRITGVDDPRWSTGVAGVAGVGVTFAVFGGLTLLLRRRTSAEPSE